LVLVQKLRETTAADDKGEQVSGDVEIDGMYVGGYVKPRTSRPCAVTVASWLTSPASVNR